MESLETDTLRVISHQSVHKRLVTGNHVGVSSRLSRTELRLRREVGFTETSERPRPFLGELARSTPTNPITSVVIPQGTHGPSGSCH